jgi:hypothetical protein
MRTNTVTVGGAPSFAVAAAVFCPLADNDPAERGGVIFGYVSCRAEHVLVAAIDAGSEFVDDGTLAGELIDPLVELFSVGLLAKQARVKAPSTYRVTDIARARVRAWRAS